MKILPDRVTEAPTPFAFEASPAWWAELSAPDRGERLAGALRFEGRAHRMGQDLYLEGSADGGVELGCSRCLTRYRHALREPFRLVLEPARNRRPPEPEGAESLERDGLYLSDEPESGWYRGDEIELEPFFREVIALALPVQPLCREDCQGLCSRCGADRNVETCDCEADHGDSPFAVLRTLRVGRTRES